MAYPIIPDEDALHQCAWCAEAIHDHNEIHGVGVVLKAGVDLSDYTGHCIELPTEADGRPLVMLVTARESEAAAGGNDGVFMVCSVDCRRGLEERLQQEVTAGKLFSAVKILEMED